MYWRKILLMAASGLPFVLASAQINYREIFRDDYDKAISYLTVEKGWMDDVILSYGLKPEEVKAIIFPELMRYNSIQDKIETFALESLYIQYGKTYANFSIGRYQIKPSFAESLEVDFLKNKSMRAKTIWPTSNDTIQNQASRSARLKRLRDKNEMLNYVCMFYKLMESKYPKWDSIEEKIKFFATAYNSDYRKTEQEIKSSISRKFFQTGLISSTKYSYGEISWFYFKNM